MSARVPDERLDELVAIADAATPGPWEHAVTVSRDAYAQIAALAEEPRA